MPCFRSTAVSGRVKPGKPVSFSTPTLPTVPPPAFLFQLAGSWSRAPRGAALAPGSTWHRPFQLSSPLEAPIQQVAHGTLPALHHHPGCQEEEERLSSCSLERCQPIRHTVRKVRCCLDSHPARCGRRARLEPRFLKQDVPARAAGIFLLRHRGGNMRAQRAL